MKQFIVESWFSVMNHQISPLKNIPDLQVRHVAVTNLSVDVVHNLLNECWLNCRIWNYRYSSCVVDRWCCYDRWHV